MRRLSATARAILLDPNNELLLSAASAWEIAIKTTIGKFRLNEPPSTFVLRNMTVNGIAELPVTFRHALHVSNLPLHHADPFDRLLLAQAQLEQVSLVSDDGRLHAYGIPMVW